MADMPYKNKNKTLFSYTGPRLIAILAELELHGLFWFHTAAQPRSGLYAHISLPVIHNHPLMLALLGLPVERSYVAVSGVIEHSRSAEDVWRERGFYVYPAAPVRLYTKTTTFSMAGTGHLGIKVATRAPAPDLTAHQLFLPGSAFKTYIIAREGAEKNLPQVIRLGAKRFGVFKVDYKVLGQVRAEANTAGEPATHPFNTRDAAANTAHIVMRHYAGNIALSGVPERAIKAGGAILAAPRFIEG